MIFFFFLSVACLIRRRNRHLTSNRTIASLSEAECWSRFNTRKEDLFEMLDCFELRLPAGEHYRADNGSLLTDEEILLIGLHRYCSCGQLKVTMLLVRCPLRTFNVLKMGRCLNYASSMSGTMVLLKIYFRTSNSKRLKNNALIKMFQDIIL
jgi:hypothetical protein